MAYYCKACGQKLGMFTGCVYVSDGIVCTPCWKKAGLPTSGDSLISAKNRYNGSMVKLLIEEREVKQELLNKYRETKTYGQLRLDENNKLFKVYDVATELGIYRYEQIVNFELLENDGVVRSGGLTNAVIGGALFGGIGAIAGAAATSSQTNCNSLKIKITLKRFFFKGKLKDTVNNKTNNEIEINYINEDNVFVQETILNARRASVESDVDFPKSNTIASHSFALIM